MIVLTKSFKLAFYNTITIFTGDGMWSSSHTACLTVITLYVTSDKDFSQANVVDEAAVCCPAPG